MEKSIKFVGCLVGLAMLAFVLNTAMSLKFGSFKEAIVERPKSYVSAENVDRTLDCLAMNIYKEAGNETFEGKVAVAQVTLNRVDSPHFPKDVCEVIYQKNVIMKKIICQFSWYCISPSKNKPDNAAYRESYAVAKKVLLEGFRLDSLNNALYYHAVYIQPKWQLQKVATIGNHVFYRGK